MKYTNRASTSRLAERSGTPRAEAANVGLAFAASVFSIPCLISSTLTSSPRKKHFRTTQTSRFPAQNPLPGEKWQFYSEKLGVKLQKQERSNLLFFPGANNTLTMTSGAHRKFPRRNGWQCAPDALCFRNTHSNRFSDLTGDSWAAGTDSPLAAPDPAPASWLSIKSSPSKLTSVESPASESVSSAGGL